MQQYAPMDMKWNLSLDYSLNYNRPTPEPPELSHSLGLNGSWKPTDKWDLNVRTHYDFRNNTIAGTFIDIQRDLGCWAMSFQWRTPFGRNPSYQLRIYVKSPKLKDLKIEKRNLPQDRITR
jgi:lipopolysaccharide assembly outer membrane protein LptD (OstA)